LASVTARWMRVKVGELERPRMQPVYHRPFAIFRKEHTLSELRLNHLQIAAPAGCEPAAREFYGEILGMVELEKPEPLRSRGGCWFQCGEHQLHIGVEEDFRPAKKAHPAFVVENLDALRKKLVERKCVVIDDENLPGISRFYSEDPWGNRLEFLDLARR
jgi:catechol 2,3-dioxygenase-like lactoylglutathione lyase family enzyme